MIVRAGMAATPGEDHGPTVATQACEEKNVNLGLPLRLQSWLLREIHAGLDPVTQGRFPPIFKGVRGDDSVEQASTKALNLLSKS